MKKGEEQAKIILESLGIEFDDSYCDDNSSESMPDLRYKDGRYLEVTHTRHNTDPLINPQNYCSKSIEEELIKQTKISEALHRASHMDYERDNMFRLTDAARRQRLKDLKILKKGLGYDPTQMDMRKQHIEFNCSNPSFYFDVGNILEAIDRKAAKHHKDNLDLFVFAQEDEFRYALEDAGKTNTSLYSHIYKSVFEKVYICEWDFFHQKYEVEKSKLICFSKAKDNSFTLDYIEL